MRRYEYTLQQIGKMLLEQEGVTHGNWELGVAFDVQTMMTAVNDSTFLPTIAVRVSAVNLVEKENPTPASFGP